MSVLVDIGPSLSMTLSICQNRWALDRSDRLSIRKTYYCYVSEHDLIKPERRITACKDRTLSNCMRDSE